MSDKTTKKLHFKNTTRKRTFNKNSNNYINNNIPLGRAHNVPDYSFLEDFLPANHYTSEANKVRALKHNSQYPYTQQNFANVAKIMEISENEKNAFAHLNDMFPSTLNTLHQATLDAYIRNISNLANQALIKYIMERYINNNKEVPSNAFKYYSSFFLKKYLKAAILSINELPLPDSLKTAYNEQLRKIILKELLRKGWFEYQM